MQDVVPSDPARDEYRQGNTMGSAYRHWRRAKLGRRYRLFFESEGHRVRLGQRRADLRSAGSKSDPYAVFEKMLGRGNPPDDWALVAASKADWRATDKE